MCVRAECSYLAGASPAAKDALVSEALALATKSLLAVEAFGDFEVALKRSLRTSFHACHRSDVSLCLSREGVDCVSAEPGERKVVLKM
jgi:hypothetical protein